MRFLKKYVKFLKENTIEEILEPAHDFTVPMHFYSVEKYPATIESSTLWIPGWKTRVFAKS